MPAREMPSSHFYATRGAIAAQHPGIEKEDPSSQPDYRPNPRHVSSNKRRPETAMQALMECPPGEEPELSKAELQPLREIVMDAVEALPPRDRYVVERLVVERLSLRQLGEQMGLSKTHLHRELRRILASLREHLGDDPIIEQYLNR